MLARPQLRRALSVLVAAVALLLAPAAAEASTVTKTADSDDGICSTVDCSLREAIKSAAPGGTVVLPASTVPYEVGDTFGSLLIAKDLTIAGAGARRTEVNAPGTKERPFTVEGAATGVAEVTIRDLSITGGDGGGAGSGAQGGGVLALPGGGANGPVLTLERVRVAGNKTSTGGKGVAIGGGIDAIGDGTHLIVRQSLVVANQAVGSGGAGARGGGIAITLGARVTVENTTIAGNEAIGQSMATTTRGGGIVVEGDLVLVNVTLFGNSAVRGEATGSLSTGGNLEVGDADEASLRNTIVGGGKADITATADCGGSFSSGGGNVLGPGCTLGVKDLFSTEPLLGPLADNGGETDTMALLAGSPALEAGVGCPPPLIDQRGVGRPQVGACDSGAFEAEPFPAPPPPPGKDFFCRNRKATLVGTSGKDRLVGSKRADVIVAKGGADTILAKGGNDLVCAGPGKDVVNGGKGKDRLLGQAGRDVLRGGPGRDALAGGAGKDLQVQ